MVIRDLVGLRVGVRKTFYTCVLFLTGLMFISTLVMWKGLLRQDCNCPSNFAPSTLSKTVTKQAVAQSGVRELSQSIPKSDIAFPSNSAASNPKLHTTRTVVILVSQRRSGTTFAGKIFGEQNGAFYLFEPLIPFGLGCNVLQEEILTTLAKILDCDFANITNEYKAALQISRYPDGSAKCVKNTVCYSAKDGHLLKDYATACQSRYGEASKPECGYPLKRDLLSELCQFASIVAVKVVRICKLQSLETMYRSLSAKGIRVFVVHLVRDLRPVLSSLSVLGFEALDAGYRKISVEQRIEESCFRHHENLAYVNRISEEISQGNASAHNFVSDGRYIRIRFEDLTSDTVGVSRKIYNFMGYDLPKEVEDWIRNSHPNVSDINRIAKEATDPKARNEAKKLLGKMKNEFATVKDPQTVLNNWRSSFSFDLTQKIQNECADSMDVLGYKKFHSVNNLRNLSLPYF